MSHRDQKLRLYIYTTWASWLAIGICVGANVHFPFSLVESASVLIGSFSFGMGMSRLRALEDRATYLEARGR